MTRKTPTDKINFGKNAGKTLAEIYQFQPSYIEWLILNIPDFCINIEMFYDLPSPTPISYRKNHFDRSSILGDEITIEKVLELLSNTDQVNHLMNVDEVILNYKDRLSPIQDFEFNSTVISKNEEKYNSSNDNI